MTPWEGQRDGCAPRGGQLVAPQGRERPDMFGPEHAILKGGPTST